MSSSRTGLAIPDWPGTITIGLVGHRRNKLSAESMIELPGRLRDLFAEFAIAARGAPVELLTGMADGADLIGAAVRPTGWSLVAILTQPPIMLAKRMGETDAADLLGICAEPATTVEILSGQFDDYRGQAGAIISRAELLVAVWDGKLGEGPGGTADSVARAKALRRPVVVLPSVGGAPRWMGHIHSETVDANSIEKTLRRHLFRGH